MAKVKRISVHICSKDRHSEIFGLLISLRNQTFKEWDLILCDDGSGTPVSNCAFVQAMLNRLRLEGHYVKTFRNEVSRGVCYARNSCIKNDDFGNDFVLRCDDDVILNNDYLERLVKVVEDYGFGCASGIVPLLGMAGWERDKINDLVINRHELDVEGNIVRNDDDCGFLYATPQVLKTIHFRTNLLYPSSAKVFYPDNLSFTGFREEFFFSLGLINKGLTIGVDTGAVAWHLQTMSGGCRSMGAAYNDNVRMDDLTLREYVKKLFAQKGDFVREYQK